MGLHPPRKSALALVALLGAGAPSLPPARAEELGTPPCGPVTHLAEEEGWRTLGQGVEFRRVSLRFGDDGGEARLSLLRLEPSRLRIRVMAMGKEGGGLQTASDWGRKTGAVAAVNGGYFTPEGKPLGLLIADGRAVNRQVIGRGGRRQLHYGAVFAVRKGVPAIVGRDEFEAPGADQALQAGPRLLEGGKAAGGLGGYRETSRLDLRAAIALDGEGRVIVFVTEGGGRGLSWCEMQRFLLLPPERGGVGAREAMNLDGGGSAQLYVRVGEFEREVRGRPVPVAIAFYPRPEGEGAR